MGALRQEISKLSMVCSTFSRSRWSVIRSASLSKGDTSKKRPSLHLHKVPTRSNRVSPQTIQTAHILNVPWAFFYISVFKSFMWINFGVLQVEWAHH
jgi:hypothetical protein